MRYAVLLVCLSCSAHGTTVIEEVVVEPKDAGHAAVELTVDASESETRVSDPVEDAAPEASSTNYCDITCQTVCDPTAGCSCASCASQCKDAPEWCAANNATYPVQVPTAHGWTGCPGKYPAVESGCKAVSGPVGSIVYCCP